MPMGYRPHAKYRHIAREGYRAAFLSSFSLIMKDLQSEIADENKALSKALVDDDKRDERLLELLKLLFHLFD
jgi:hypothetical protein